MSGGQFNYEQFRISNIEDGIERLIKTNNRDDGFHFNDEVIEKFTEALEYLRIARIMANRIDWLVSGDDSEETFFERLNEEVAIKK